MQGQHIGGRVGDGLVEPGDQRGAGRSAVVLQVVLSDRPRRRRASEPLRPAC